MKKVELLAPAGNMEALKAAIEAGCDAVYLSGKMYGARAFAGNFTKEEIKDAINYSHLYGVKVYLTVNTIIYESEVEKFIDFIRYVHQNNIDAVLLQDFGMLDLVRKKFPNLELHASTQMHIHDLNGVLMAKKLGIKRVVIARETSILEIKKIKEKTDIEIECFVHGALCVSYSGQCYMSTLIGSRSANRGTCTQNCRKKYNLYDEDNNKLNTDNYLLSTKDLCTLYDIDKIISSGADSLKIEGRMKSKEYVYQVVSMYRKAIDLYYEKNKIIVDDKDIYNLKKLFNREFTKGFILGEQNSLFTNEKRPNHQGVMLGKVIDKKSDNLKIKLYDDVTIGDGLRILDEKIDKGIIIQSMFINNKKVLKANKDDIITIKYNGYVKKGSIILKTSDKELVNEIDKKINEKARKVLIDVFVLAHKNDYLKITISDGINVVNYTSTFLIEEALKSPTGVDIIRKQVSKIKDTVYKINNLRIDMDKDIFINLKDINEVRRKAIELLNNKRLYKTNFTEKDYSINLPDFDIVRKKSALIYDESKLNNVINNYDIIFVLNKKLLINDKCFLKVPRILNNNKDYDKKVLIGDIGSTLNYKRFDTDFSLNVTNSYAVAFLHSIGANKITLSYELNINKIEDIITAYKKRYNKNPNLEVILNGNKEAMICKYDLNKKYDKKIAYLEDEYKNRYKVVSYDNYMVIYDYHKNDTNNYDDYYKIGVNYIRNNF